MLTFAQFQATGRDVADLAAMNAIRTFALLVLACIAGALGLLED